MLYPHHPSLFSKVLRMIALLGIMISGCQSQSTQVPRLRITNNGSLAIYSFVVIFPQDRIDFGDIPAGTTSEYKNVPNGVFAYAAYEFKVNREITTQPVIDWIGENPMSGNLFTYTIDFDPTRVDTGDMIRVIGVKNDD